MSFAVNGSYWAGAAVGAALTIPLLNTCVLPADLGWRFAFGLGILIVAACTCTGANDEDRARHHRETGQRLEDRGASGAGRSRCSPAYAVEPLAAQAPTRVHATSAFCVSHISTCLAM